MFSRYNGENGVIGAIRVWECKSKDGLEEYLKDTRKCNRVMPQCQVGCCFPVFFEVSSLFQHRDCSSPGVQAVWEKN